MKIYFADRQLRPYNDCDDAFHGERMVNVVDGEVGFRRCQTQMERLKHSEEKNVRLITNVPYFMSSEYGWNNETLSFDVLIECKSGKFVNVHELTNRELRKGHNLCKLYISGEFDEKIASN